MDIVAVIAVLCAYLVKGMCGFANTLVFSTIMSFKANNIMISPIELIVGYPSNILIAWKERKSISAKICIPLSALVILGSIPGALFLKNGNTQLIKLLFGVVVVFIGLEMFFREFQKGKEKTSPVILIILGILSGILCGLFGIGALLAAYVSRTTENSSAFKGNICIVFLVENSFRIILYSVIGIVDFEILKNALMLFPFMLIGLFAGMFLSKSVSERIVKNTVIILLIFSGISLIINSISVFV
ncbi:MAG: sulfite exporter TauE/SafE family protein [Eubacteriales bacterium]